MSDPGSDGDLLERIRRDEPGAFDDFVRRHGGRIQGFGLRVCGDRADAEDIAQETLLQAYRSLRSVEDPAALRSWLFRVAANACRMSRRKRGPSGRDRSLDEAVAGATARPSLELRDRRPLPDEQASRDEEREAVQRAVLELPPEYRLVLVMRDMEQLSTRETAFALDVPESTVKMRLHRARRLLRTILEARPG